MRHYKIRGAIDALGLSFNEWQARQIARSDVDNAYRRRLKDVHPDTGGAIEGAAMRLKVIKDAYKTLTGALVEPPPSTSVCRTCRGAGRVRIKSFAGKVSCPACKGKGEASA